MNNRSIISVIDRTRERVRQTSDDSRYSDLYIYHSLLDVRNTIVERELNKRVMRSSFNYKPICMPLIESRDIPCDCIPEALGCIALKSKYPIPKPISSNYSDALIITSIDGSNEFAPKNAVSGKYSKYTRLANPPAYYLIYDDYLYIIGEKHNDLPAVLIQIIPEDPVSMDNITLCDKDGNELDDTCFDPTKDDFNVDGHLTGVIIKEVVQQLTQSIAMIEDTTNNSASEGTPDTI